MLVALETTSARNAENESAGSLRWPSSKRLWPIRSKSSGVICECHQPKSAFSKRRLILCSSLEVKNSQLAAENRSLRSSKSETEERER